MGACMDIDKEIAAIERQLEEYEDTNNPEDRMDIKQTIRLRIMNIKSNLNGIPANLKKQVLLNLDEFEEILSY